MSNNLLETIFADRGKKTQSLTADISAHILADPGCEVLKVPVSSCGRSALRALIMGRQCLAFECLREAISVCDIEADFCSIDDQITERTWDYGVFVMLVTKCGPGMPALIWRRMNELRSCMPRIPTMAFLEDANADAAALSHLGFSTIIMGLPSLNFAVTAIRLLSLGAHTTAAIDIGTATNRAPEPRSQEPGETHDLGAISTDVSFTKRELDLIDLLRSGMQNKLMAFRLGISESTVKAHLRNIMTKLHAKNRTQTVFMLSRGILR
jgi:DNA-binding NarL/FixJ family response regulator